MVSLVRLQQGLLDIIVEEFDHLRASPKHLAWVVMNYDLLQDLSSDGAFVVVDTTEAIPIQQTYERLDSDEDQKLLWAAFDLIRESFGRFPDANPNVALQMKSNKTFDEWVELLTTVGDFDYYTHSRDKVLADLLGHNGSTHYRWNDDGYLMRVGRSGVEYRVFFGYTGVEDQVPQSIRERVLRIRDDPEIANATAILLERYQKQRQRIYDGEPWKKVLVPQMAEQERATIDIHESYRKAEELQAGYDGEPSSELPEPKEIEFSLDPKSNLVIAPTNAHPSYLGAGKEISDRILAVSTHDSDSLHLSRQFLEKLESGYFQRSQ